MLFLRRTNVYLQKGKFMGKKLLYCKSTCKDHVLYDIVREKHGRGFSDCFNNGN